MFHRGAIFHEGRCDTGEFRSAPVQAWEVSHDSGAETLTEVYRQGSFRGLELARDHQQAFHRRRRH